MFVHLCHDMVVGQPEEVVTCFVSSLTSLTPSLPNRLENVKLPSSDTDVAPPYVVRALFMYGRSYSMPVYKTNLDVSLEKVAL